MTISRSKILSDLERQESDDGQSDDIEILKWFLGCCKNSSQWNSFVNVVWEKTGPMSYQNDRQWIPSEELRKLAESIRIPGAVPGGRMNSNIE